MSPLKQASPTGTVSLVLAGALALVLLAPLGALAAPEPCSQPKHAVNYKTGAPCAKLTGVESPAAPAVSADEVLLHEDAGALVLTTPGKRGAFILDGVHVGDTLRTMQQQQAVWMNTVQGSITNLTEVCPADSTRPGQCARRRV